MRITVNQLRRIIKEVVSEAYTYTSRNPWKPPPSNASSFRRGPGRMGYANSTNPNEFGADYSDGSDPSDKDDTCTNCDGEGIALARSGRMEDCAECGGSGRLG